MRKVLRLTFKGQKAGEPIISKMVKRYDVEVNILVGWIDTLQGMIIGNLVIEIAATQPNLEQVLAYLRDNDVHVEELTDVAR